MIGAEPDDVLWGKYDEEIKSISESNLRSYPSDHPLHKFFQKHLADAWNCLGIIYDDLGNIPNKNILIRT